MVPHRSLAAATLSGPALHDIRAGVGSVFLNASTGAFMAAVTGVAPGDGPMPWCNVPGGLLIGNNDDDERVVREEMDAYAGPPLGASAIRAACVLAQRAAVPSRRTAALAMLAAMARASFTPELAWHVHRPSVMAAITATLLAPPRLRWNATMARLILEAVEKAPGRATPATVTALRALRRPPTRRSALPKAQTEQIRAALDACLRLLSRT
jgi:hypothetical protein